ncbi:MAG: serine/threonine-protein kinase, partial [Gemmatimonadetes bacterium]|nr:serine/threonine-protein kinase [Gemmatimonadota bacterium]
MTGPSGSAAAERWRRVQEIFLEAAEKHGAEREAFLVSACGDDADLRTEVDELLAADADEVLLDATLDDLALFVDDDIDDGDGDPAPADGRAGPYRIVEELGRGGMGVVYRAERVDDQYTRQVALKVVGAPGVDPDELARRFARERQILGALEHPNIARLYDAGVSADGRSWLAMELVVGQPIHRWCDARALDVDARLAVFEKVVAAVDYAHRNLVVHRDLKPSNILVTDDGEVKLLDFGIAKLLDDDGGVAGSGDDVPLTRAHQRVLTPEYASPEQMKGGRVTTASDVYALGVLLHELLTGRRPDVDPESRDLTTRPSAVVARAPSPTPAAQHDPVAAAHLRSTTPSGLRRRLEGDLDTIVRAALRAEPELRFPSAAALLDDLVRYREGRPLQVRPPSATYLVRKFVARNRVAVVAVAVVFASLVLGAAVSWRQARIAQAERDVARSVSRFLEGLFLAADPFAGEERLDTLRVGAILQRATERLDTALADQPEVRARMLRILGSAYQGTGEVERSRGLLDRAIASYQALERGTDPEVQQALVALGRVELTAGNPTASVDTYARALDLAARRSGPDSPEAGAIRLELAGSLLTLDRLDEAAAELERGLAAVSGGESRPSPAEMARHLNLLGSLQYRQGRVGEAIETLTEALATTRAAWGADHPQTAILGQNLGLALHRAGRSVEAEPVVREALGRLEAAFGPDHPLVGVTLKTLANTLEAQDRWDEAESVYRGALAHSRRTAGEASTDVANAAHDLGQALAKRDRLAEAEALLEESLAVERAVSGPNAPAAGVVGAALAGVRRRMGNPVAAEAGFRDALAILEGALPPT